MQSQLTQFNSFYRNINNGDRYTLLYIPQIGIQLYLNNDILLGTIDFTNMTTVEQYDLARIVYSVWFGPIAPFSITMRDELLIPLSRPTITTTALQPFQRNAMNVSLFNMNNNNNNHRQYHHIINIAKMILVVVVYKEHYLVLQMIYIMIPCFGGLQLL